MSWFAHLLDRCCFCWCSLFHEDGYYDESNEEDEGKDNALYKTGTVMIKLSGDAENRDSVDGTRLSTIRVDFDFESLSDSVEDDRYYDDYVINKYSNYIENNDKRIFQACRMLETARNTVNTCTKLENWDESKVGVICMCYESSIGTLDSQQSTLKRKIIKEYESVKSRVPANCLQDSKIEIEDLLGNARRVDVCSEDRKKSYRIAIKLTVNMEVKKRLKKEYNEFLFLSGSINKYI